MPKQPPWKKRFCISLLLLLFCYGILVEFGAVVLFFAGIFGLSALWVLGRSWWKERRKRLRLEEERSHRAEAGQAAVERRRNACREARYAPEERERVEDRLRQDLGPIAAWDLEEKTDGVLCVDVALLPPTERLPFWKAATVGAGACILEAGGAQITPQRMELVMALPPDWDSSQRWPGRILRSAAWECLITEGFVGYRIYRSFGLVSAGFGGAVVDGEFPGLPELAHASMPESLSVGFYWLLPLLKPEADYAAQRGLAELERRIPASCPWADPARRPWADFVTWFQEDIAPFAWSEDDGLYCLGLEFGTWHQELFEQAGYTNRSWAWERLARGYLRRYQPDDLPFVEFACEERVFFAASRDEEIMRRLALGLSDLLRWRPEEARRLLE